jgi:hypothetical protein
MAYLFDTNTLLEAKNRCYAFDVSPAFWDWLLKDQYNILNELKARYIVEVQP